MPLKNCFQKLKYSPQMSASVIALTQYVPDHHKTCAEGWEFTITAILKLFGQMCILEALSTEYSHYNVVKCN